MRTLFNDNWQFFELPLNENEMFVEGKPNLLSPDTFFESSINQTYENVTLPHDYQIYHVNDLYKNSVGLYKKSFTLTKEQAENHVALNFESVYMNCAIWINGKKTFEWKYGYTTFEVDLTGLVHEGENLIQVILVYQNCNTRWYSGAGIIRDVNLICTKKTYLVTDGVYIVNKKSTNKDNANIWESNISVEVKTRETCNSQNQYKIKNLLINKDGNVVLEKDSEILAQSDETKTIKITQNFEINNPSLWEIENPYYYICKTQLIDETGEIIDEISQNCGFKSIEFDCDKGFFLNGKHIKLNGVCHHHDQGVLGAAFNPNALRRQFNKLKEMGVNAIRCSHNPPPAAWMNLADEMGFLIIDEIFDMWEKSKTPFDYANYFNEWCLKDVESWVKKDRNHPCLLMWSIGNEIYDTHNGNGIEITKKLYKAVKQFDSETNALITMASNYMWSDGAQECAKYVDVVGYNYLERLYDEHHKKNPLWKIYGSETGSTVQSRGIYHFPETLKLITFSDGQCSTLGNCTVPWGAANTQTLLTWERDCAFSAGQFIWTGWDYIGEPTPYHTKNSYFGQIDTAGFPKDTFYLYKAIWGGKAGEKRGNEIVNPFVHLLPYWDWNEGQIIDVKAYTNAPYVELFFNGNSLGKQIIDFEKSNEPFGRWQVEYHKGEIKAICYDDKGNFLCEEIKRSFEYPAKIILQPETQDTGNLHFVDIMVCDKNDELVENARNYITFNVTGDAELIGLDNGDSTDYDEYTPCRKQSSANAMSRKLFSNRLVAVIRSKKSKRLKSTFVITAASKDLPTVSKKFDGDKWIDVAPYYAIRPEKDYIPVRKIELSCEGNVKLNSKNNLVNVQAKILPENATDKNILWNPVLKECVPIDFIEVGEIQNEETQNIKSAQISAKCDGECILRCTAQNGSTLDEVISDLPFTVSEMGNSKLNPYKLIEACRFTSWDGDREKTPICLESGISNREIGPTWIAFDKVDFGVEGADTIHLPIFSFETSLPIEVWDGTPGNGTTKEGGVPNADNTLGEKLGAFVYKSESIYNTYQENVFTLKKRLFGVHTLSIVLPHEIYFKGFYFDQTKKTSSKLRALDANLVSGDSFTKNENADVVEHIGNNVSLDFENMDFGNDSCDNQKFTITVCGKSHKENATINIKFFGDDGKIITQIIEFSQTKDYIEKTFELKSIHGKQKVSFVFLPGCDFDFKWFKFDYKLKLSGNKSPKVKTL